MLESLLQNFLTKEVNPERDIVSQASDTQGRMQRILEDKLAEGEDLPSLLNSENFLFGSAIRGTQPAPFDDEFAGGRRVPDAPLPQCRVAPQLSGPQ